MGERGSVLAIGVLLAPCCHLAMYEVRSFHAQEAQDSMQGEGIYGMLHDLKSELNDLPGHCTREHRTLYPVQLTHQKTWKHIRCSLLHLSKTSFDMSYQRFRKFSLRAGVNIHTEVRDSIGRSSTSCFNHLSTQAPAGSDGLASHLYPPK